MNTRQHFHPGKLTGFVLLGAADLFLTWKLIQGGHGRVYESNPVAGAWLEAYGWAGLAVFKVLAMLLVGLAALYVSWHRPRTGGRILAFGCLATAGVVVYSCYLLGHPEGRRRAIPDEDPRQTEQVSRRLDRELQKERAYHVLLARLGQDLIAGRSSLAEAVQELAGSEKGRDPHWLERLRGYYPDRSDTECLALHLTFRTLIHAQDSGAPCQPLVEELEAAYARSYGEPVRLLFADENSAEPKEPPLALRASPWGK